MFEPVTMSLAELIDLLLDSGAEPVMVARIEERRQLREINERTARILRAVTSEESDGLPMLR